MTARSRPGQEAVEAFCEAFSIRTERYRLWYRDRLSVKALQQIEHRAVLLVEQAGRDPDRVVSVDPDKVMIKGTMVNRAEAEAVVHRCFPVCLEVADDVGGIEQSCLLEPTDSALIAVGRQDTTAEPRLMDSDVRLTHDVATLDRVLDAGWLLFVEGAAHGARLNENLECGRIVGHDEAREYRSVAPDAGRDEVDDRRPELEGCTHRTAVAMAWIGTAVGVEDAVGRLAIVVGAVDRGLDRQDRGPPCAAARKIPC